MSHRFRLVLLGAAVGALLLGACSGHSTPPGGDPAPDAGPVDGGGNDGGENDGGNPDAGPVDGGGACVVPPVSISHGTELPGSAIVHLLSTTAHPEAICNDGTPAAYIFRPGVGRGAHRWIIYLEGGGSCYSGSDCLDRYNKTPVYMTSRNFTDGQVYKRTLEGIKSADPTQNPDFYDANLLQLVYCSSDTWSGDTAADPNAQSGDVTHWHFRGKKIIQAVLQDMSAQGLASADEVFLMGSSAGGLGLVSNIDDVATMVPSSARFVAMMDASFFFDYPDYDSSTGSESTAVPTHRTTDMLTAAQVWGGRGNAQCDAVATTFADHAGCRNSSAVIQSGFVTAPLFIRQSEYDNVQLSMLSPDGTTPNAGYQSRFAQAMASHLGQLSAVQNVAIFGTHDTEHGVINSNSEWSVSTVNGLQLPQSIGEWYRDPCAHMAKNVAAP